MMVNPKPFWTLLLIICLIVWGCGAGPARTPISDDSDPAMFRHRWWNYYSRGLGLAEQREHARAMDDFQTALRKRDGDQYMARTYGMHFVDYFPHREMGIVLWEMNRLAQAQRQLETSIAQTPTAKAYYFLDRVREAQIRKMMQQHGPVEPPNIQIHQAADGIRTREDPVMIQGSVIDQHYVASVKVDGKAWFLPGTAQRVDFCQPLQLPDGLHQIVVCARSLSGASRQQRIDVYVDRQGPVIEVQAVERARVGSGLKWAVRGRCIDPGGVASMDVDGNRLGMADGPIEPFDVTIGAPSHVIELAAQDRLGNITRVELPTDDFNSLSRSRPAILLASSESLPLIGGLVPSTDRQPPRIRLDGWTASQTVYMNKAIIQGSVRDNRRISSITINQRQVSATALTGLFAGFSSTVALHEGENTIVISATDAAGNQAVETIVINRCDPQVRLLRERLSVSVLPFAAKGLQTSASDGFQDVFIQQLSLQNRFNLVDRALLDAILQEHRISQTDLVAPETALKMGHLLAADAFLDGRITETRLGVEVSSRFVDTETAEILAMMDAFAETASSNALKQTAEQLAIKLHREFPVVEGEILDRQRRVIFTDLGSDQLRAQRRILIVNKEAVKHPVSGKPLGYDYKVIGRARLFQIQQAFSKGELYLDHISGIKPRDGVVTQ